MVSTTNTERRTGRAPLFRHPWRVAITVGVLILVLNLGAVLLNESDTSRTGRAYPNAIDTVSPEPGDLIRPLDTITADLRDDLTGVLVIARGTTQEEIPEDQLERVIPLGQVSFRPGPGKDITQFTPGDYTATVLFWPQGKDRPSTPGSYSWSFRVGA